MNSINLNKIIFLLFIMLVLIGCLNGYGNDTDITIRSGHGKLGRIDKEALKQALPEFKNQIAKCGGAWCFYENSQKTYWQFTKAEIIIIGETTEASILNGIEWQGEIHYHLYGACRHYQSSVWTNWIDGCDYQYGPGVVLFKSKEGNWNTSRFTTKGIKGDTFKEISCSDVPN